MRPLSLLNLFAILVGGYAVNQLEAAMKITVLLKACALPYLLDGQVSVVQHSTCPFHANLHQLF